MAPLHHLFYCFLLIVSINKCTSSSNRNNLRDEAAPSVYNGPEDLFLEELIDNWRSIHRPLVQRPMAAQLPRIWPKEIEPIPSGDESEEDPEPPRALPDQAEHKFAYRPSEPQYYIPARPTTIQQQQQQQQPAVEPIVVNSIRSLGQKEDIDFLNDPHPQSGSTGSIAAGGAVVVESVATEPVERDGPVAHAIVSPRHPTHHRDSFSDIYFTALVAGCTAIAVAAILGFGVCFYRWQRRAKAAQEVEYPAYGITGPGPSPGSKSLSLKASPSSTSPSTGSWLKSPKMTMAVTGDKKLAHSAHMFHFQHQKQQVIAMESHSACDRHGSNSGGESDEDNEEGDYTVYECPGLASTGEMEVKNPLFLDDPTPASPANLVKRQSE